MDAATRVQILVFHLRRVVSISTRKRSKDEEERKEKKENERKNEG